MQRARETGITPQARGASGAARLAIVGWSGALFALALLSGCNMMQRSKGAGEPDPLVGEMHKQTYVPTPPGKTTSSKSADPNPIPTFPDATSTASIGSIAGGDPRMGNHPLGIPSAAASQKQPAAASQGTKLTSAQANASMNPGLRAPVVEALPAAPSAGGLSTTGAVAPPWTNPAAQVSYEQLQQQLTARGMSWYRQETWQDGVKFSCSVPNPINRDFSRTYEATARDFKSALIAVIDQIDRDRPQR